MTQLENLSIFFDRVIETQFIEVELRPGHSIVIASIYRPNTHPTFTETEQLDQFLEIFSNILAELASLNKTCYLLTDSNLDLLKVNSHNRTQTYIDNIFEQKFLQVITKVTRSFRGSVSLIDHIITNSNSSHYTSGIFINDISDHFPTFHILGENSKKSLPKSISKRNFSDENIKTFCDNIQTLSWVDVFDCDNTQEAYNTFWDIFSPLFELYFPLKTVKFNRNFHKIEPWITQGLLVSRRRKYSLRDIFRKFPTIENKGTYTNHRNIYNRTLRNSKQLYYQSQLEENQNNIKKLGKFYTKSPKNVTINLLLLRRSRWVSSPLLTMPK